MKKLLKTLQGEKFNNPPIWLMRQAGRYLPEYRELRSKSSNFLELCYNPKLASEVTLQPIRRFGFDGAIIFSDILVIPDALGIKVNFIKNEGPKLQQITNEKELLNLNINNIIKHLQPVFDNINLTKSKLDDSTTLIGFSGSPWTIATYIIEGGGSKNFENVKKIAISNSAFFEKLINILVESISIYLCKQIEAGSEVIKLFDSWAGVLSESEFKKWVINPNKRIVNNIKEKYPNIPIIAFAKGSGTMYEDFSEEMKFNALAIDQTISRKWAKETLQQKLNLIIQGNFNNFNLAYGNEESITKEVLLILEYFNDHPFIFNLDHGIFPNTPIKNVELLIDLVRNNKL